MASSNLRSEAQMYDNQGKKFKPTITPTPNFSAKRDAAELCSSMRVWGLDEAKISGILGRRTCSERQQIMDEYRKAYKRELVHDLNGDLTGHFRDATILLTETPEYLMAKSLFYAMKGVGMNEMTIIEILVGCNAEEIKRVKTAYVHVLRDKKIKDPKRTLESDIRAETTGNFGKMCMQILKADTPDPTPDQLANLQRSGPASLINKNQAVADARSIFEAKGKPNAQIEDIYFRVFSKKHIWQLWAIANEFEQMAHKPLVNTITEQIKGEFGSLLIAMVEHATDRPKFYSDLLYYSMLGEGTHDFLLMRVMILRSEIDLGNIKACYDRDHHGLEQAIKEDTTGPYSKILLTILGI